MTAVARALGRSSQPAARGCGSGEGTPGSWSAQPDAAAACSWFALRASSACSAAACSAAVLLRPSSSPICSESTTAATSNSGGPVPSAPRADRQL